MILAKRPLPLASLALLAFLVLFSGCTRKPQRPTPLDTVMGGGERSEQLDITSLGGPGAFAAGEEPLQARAAGGDDFAASGERGLLPEVYFDFDSSSIKPSERPKLDQIASFLQRNPDARALLEGHCDWRGTSEYNLALGDRRAKSVERYLTTLGIPDSRLTTVSKGDLEATEGASSEVMARERKVDVVINR